MKLSGLLIGAAGLTGAYFGVRALVLKRLNDEIQVISSVNINKLTFSSLELRIDLLLKNPTSGTVDVKYPFVKIYYDGSMLGSSEVKDKDFPLPKYSQMTVDPIYLPIPLPSLISLAPKMLNDLQAGNSIALQVTAVTTLNNTVPYTRTDTITIKPGSNAGKKS
jgi:hypothetical protein